MLAQGAGLPAPAHHSSGETAHALIPILLYHSVPRAGSRNAGRLAVEHNRFARHLDAILESGRTALTLSELAAGLRNERELPQRPVATTFDDGYSDTADAIELLCSRGLRASVFITTGRLGSAAMLAAPQLRRLAETPHAVELGAHSVTHPHLDELGLAEIEHEVSASKRQLEQILGRAVQSFAYPYGAYDRRVRDAVAAAGFQAAAAVKNAVSHGRDDPLAIARWTVRSTTTPRRIAEVLEGEGVPPAWRRERLRTSGYRNVRRLRRTLSRTVAPWP
jgi:peptidoglycan/xylan/chitin deacetylase (PgdA/CDA1 family)